MSMKEVEKFLHDHEVKFRTVRHSPAYTSHEIAQAAHVPGRRLAKVTMVKLNGELAMAVLPASEMVDLNALKELAGAKEAKIATEKEFASKFPDCEVGAMPPFGNLWGIPVFVSDGFHASDDVAFEAGSHSELLEMPYVVYERLVNPRIGHFAS